MAFQSIPNTAEITIFYEQNNESMANVLHATRAAGYDQENIDKLAEMVDDLVATYLLPEMTSECAYLRTEVRGLDTENDLFALDDTSAAPGDVGTTGLPNSVTLSLKKGSGQTGRSARGRWYFVGIPAASLSTNENQFLTAAVTSMVSAVNNLRNGLSDFGWDSVIASRYTGGVLRDPGVTFSWTSLVAVNELVDTQRRRLSN